VWIFCGMDVTHARLRWMRAPGILLWVYSAAEGGFFNSRVGAFFQCLVPACGYYEWQGEGRDKTPYYIHPQDDQYLAFAGLYDVWQRPDGEDLYTFTIITTDADEYMA
jgi:putative SOS response-associated peptidase YedK